MCRRSSVGSEADGLVVLVGVITRLPKREYTGYATSALLSWKNHSQRGSIEQVPALWGNAWKRWQITERAAVLFLVLHSRRKQKPGGFSSFSIKPASGLLPLGGVVINPTT